MSIAILAIIHGHAGRQTGAPINDGFLGDDAVHQTADNFANLTEPTWSYTPFVPEQFEGVKVPDWAERYDLLSQSR